VITRTIGTAAAKKELRWYQQLFKTLLYNFFITPNWQIIINRSLCLYLLNGEPGQQ
jgi:hypothetical protein